MLVSYSKNPFKVVLGILHYNYIRISIFTLIAFVAWFCYDYSQMSQAFLPVVPVTILGGALAIFLGFRNNSAYDRWWEARKIWGGIVNLSRTWAMEVMSLTGEENGTKLAQEEIGNYRREMIYRHIGWLHACRIHLRKQNNWEELKEYLVPDEYERLLKLTNKPVQMLNAQGQRLQWGFQERIIEDFRHMQLVAKLEELYTLQGKAERIKNTIFPYYYNFFTRVFLWLFAICLPFALIRDLGVMAIPMSVAINFVFSILEKSGTVTEDPFENRAADTPISTIVRSIEIDMKEILGDTLIPDPPAVERGRFGVLFQK